MQRYRFFGQDSISFLWILPIALPGIVTAVALQNSFNRTHRPRADLVPDRVRLPRPRHRPRHVLRRASPTTTWSRGCAARRRTCSRRPPTSARRPTQTFRYVTFPLVRSALVAGGILAFALSFDEIVVTTFTAGSGFQTLPQWILANISRPNNVPLVNVMATFVMAVSIPLAWLAQRLSDGGHHRVGLGGGREPA